MSVTCSCSGPLLEEGKLREAVEGGLHSQMYVELVGSLCEELKSLNHMQESVSRPAGEPFRLLHVMLPSAWPTSTYMAAWLPW